MSNSLRLRSIVVVVALTSAFGSSAFAQPSDEELASNPALLLELARKSLKWDEPADPVKIAGPIYFVGTRGLGVFLITTSEGHIVVNTGMPGSGPMIAASIRKLGFDPAEIRIILTGHAHVDHVGGHAYLKQLSGARIAMIREEQELFQSGGKLDFQYGTCPEFGFEPAQVGWVFQDGDEIKLGDVTLLALLTNGHTRGSMTFVTKIVDGGKEYSVVFPNGAGVNPGYRLVKDPSYEGIADAYRRTFRILESLEPDIWLHAHNDSFDLDGKLARSATEGVQAWIDPDGYRTWVAGKREKFEAAVVKENGD